MFPEYRARKDKPEGREEMLGLQVHRILSNSIPYMPGQNSFIHCKTFSRSKSPLYLGESEALFVLILVLQRTFRNQCKCLASMGKNVFSLAILVFSLSVSLHECLILISLPFLAAAYYCMLIPSLQALGETPVG